MEGYVFESSTEFHINVNSNQLRSLLESAPPAAAYGRRTALRVPETELLSALTLQPTQEGATIIVTGCAVGSDTRAMQVVVASSICEWSKSIVTEPLEADPFHWMRSELVYDVTVAFTARDLDRLWVASRAVSDAVCVKCTENSVSFIPVDTNYNEFAGQTTTLFQKDATEYVYEHSCVQYYNLHLISCTEKAARLSQYVELCVGSDVPLCLNYLIGPDGYLRFYMSPIIRAET